MLAARNGALIALAGALTQQLIRGSINFVELYGAALFGAGIGVFIARMARRRA